MLPLRGHIAMTGIVVRGTLSGSRHIELDHPVTGVSGEIEVTIRKLNHESGTSVLTSSSGCQQAAGPIRYRERAGGRPQPVAQAVNPIYLDVCCIIYLVEVTEPFHSAVTSEGLLAFQRYFAIECLMAAV
jgi:hypothetical protein